MIQRGGIYGVIPYESKFLLGCAIYTAEGVYVPGFVSTRTVGTSYEYVCNLSTPTPNPMTFTLKPSNALAVQFQDEQGNWMSFQESENETFRILRPNSERSQGGITYSSMDKSYAFHSTSLIGSRFDSVGNIPINGSTAYAALFYLIPILFYTGCGSENVLKIGDKEAAIDHFTAYLNGIPTEKPRNAVSWIDSVNCLVDVQPVGVNYCDINKRPDGGCFGPCTIAVNTSWNGLRLACPGDPVPPPIVPPETDESFWKEHKRMIIGGAIGVILVVIFLILLILVLRRK